MNIESWVFCIGVFDLLTLSFLLSSGSSFHCPLRLRGFLIYSGFFYLPLSLSASWVFFELRFLTFRNRLRVFYYPEHLPCSVPFGFVGFLIGVSILLRINVHLSKSIGLRFLPLPCDYIIADECAFVNKKL